MAQRKSSKKEPQILEMPSQKMAVVYAKGAPDEAGITVAFILEKESLSKRVNLINNLLDDLTNDCKNVIM